MSEENSQEGSGRFLGWGGESSRETDGEFPTLNVAWRVPKQERRSATGAYVKRIAKVLLRTEIETSIREEPGLSGVEETLLGWLTGYGAK